MERKRARRIAVVAVAVVVVVGIASGTYEATTGGGSSTGPGSSTPASKFQLISVSGNQLMQNGQPDRLIGVDIASSQYYCLGNNTTPFAMPADSASISALLSWHVNTVRILLNQDCWLGLDGQPHATTVGHYRQSVESFVSMLNAAHLEVVLAMWSNVPIIYSSTNGKGQAKHQTNVQTLPMANAQYAQTFWTSVSSAFRDYSGVMFDLYGEPHQISWPCWKNGCTISGQKYVGMQQLVDAVRQSGARQPLLLGGVDYSNNLSDWLSYEPTDPLHQLVASVHIYSFTTCSNVTCWNKEVATVAHKVPVVTGEFGATACSTTFTKRYMKWADKHAVSYIAWAWFVGTCAADGPLVSDFSGTAAAYGSEYQNNLEALYKAGDGNVGSVSAGATVARSESKKNK